MGGYVVDLVAANPVKYPPAVIDAGFDSVSHTVLYSNVYEKGKPGVWKGSDIHLTHEVDSRSCDTSLPPLNWMDTP